jgi:hypothetical protein
MLVHKNTRLPVIPAREISPSNSPANPAAAFANRIDAARERFRQGPVTPATTLALENELKAIADEICASVLEQELNGLEPDRKEKMPRQVRYHKQTYRINKKTPVQVSTRFGKITLRSFYYLNREEGESGLHPLYLRLGIGPGMATPALAERVARMAVDHTQTEVRAWLLQEHGVTWTNTRLRAVLADFRRRLLPFVAQGQKAKLLAWLFQAESSRGRNRPVLAAGRDGVMVPMRNGHYQEASTATVSVYDRRRRRLGTIYLGRMPESKQTSLSRELTSLLTEVLKDYTGPRPRLVYVTDKGSAPEEYYRRVLKKMRDPRNPEQKLPWEWVLDFYHVCGYVSKMADALFGVETREGRAWYVKMRHWLRHRRQGAANVERSAKQHLATRSLTAAEKAEFWKAYRFVRRNNRWMDYPEYRRRGLPIGSGVTEAACKTVFTQRFKRSGMRWNAETGQVILDLRTIYLSGIWKETVVRDFASREIPEPLNSGSSSEKRGSCAGSRECFYRMAA